MAKRHFVTFAIPNEEANVVITEYLRYAGIISVANESHSGRTVPWMTKNQFGEGKTLVTMECPKGLTPLIWAEQNVRRLQSFGVQAVYWVERN